MVTLDRGAGERNTHVMHAHKHLSWTVAWVLTAAGISLYLLYPETLTFWIGFAAVVPLLVLIAFRNETAGGRGDGDAGGPFDAPTA